MQYVPKLTILASLFSGLIFFIACSFVLLNGHLHEDAYILFIYAENLANHNFIGYSLGTGRAEGATDFLWMIILSGLVYLGLDIGWAAAILNSVSIFNSIHSLNYLVKILKKLTFYNTTNAFCARFIFISSCNCWVLNSSLFFTYFTFFLLFDLCK